MMEGYIATVEAAKVFSSRDGMFEAFQVVGLWNPRVISMVDYLPFWKPRNSSIFTGYKLITPIFSRDQNMMKTFMFHGVGVQG